MANLASGQCCYAVSLHCTAMSCLLAFEAGRHAPASHTDCLRKCFSAEWALLPKRSQLHSARADKAHVSCRSALTAWAARCGVTAPATVRTQLQLEQNSLSCTPPGSARAPRPSAKRVQDCMACAGRPSATTTGKKPHCNTRATAVLCRTCGAAHDSWSSLLEDAGQDVEGRGRVALCAMHA